MKETTVKMAGGAAAMKRGGRPKLTLDEKERKARRRAQQAASKRKGREALAAAGSVLFSIVLTALEIDEYERLQRAYKGPKDNFLKASLLVGMRFAANAGQGKRPAKGTKGRVW